MQTPTDLGALAKLEKLKRSGVGEDGKLEKYLQIFTNDMWPMLRFQSVKCLYFDSNLKINSRQIHLLHLKLKLYADRIIKR